MKRFFAGCLAVVALGGIAACQPSDLGCDYIIPQCVASCGGPAIDNLAGGERCLCPAGTFLTSECSDGATPDGSQNAGGD